MNARFGGGVVDLSVLTRLPVDRADIDDAAPFACPHTGESRLRHVETSTKIDAHHIVPILKAHFVKRAVAGDARVVDDNIDRAKLFFDSGAAFKAGFVIADIPFARNDAGRLREGGGLFVVAAIIGDDRVSLAFEALADGFPDPACSACDDGYSAHFDLSRLVCARA